jgi:gliding-associated putative ABC transporter substrate-binding component GldG
MKNKKITALLQGWWLPLSTVLMGCVILNILGSIIFTRVDLTADKRFSLSPLTIKEAEKLDDILFIKVYLDGELPTDYRRLRDATRELLDEYRAYAGDMLHYEFVDLSLESDEKQRENIYKKLVKEGLRPVTLSENSLEKSAEQFIIPGAIVSYKGRSLPWMLLRTQLGQSEVVMINNSIQQLEYGLSVLLRNLQRSTQPKVAFLEGNGELEENDVADISKTLSQFYEVERVSINGQLKALATTDLLIIAGPDSVVSEKDKFIIDQFIMRGGRALWLVEPVHVNEDSLRSKGITLALSRELNIEDMMFKYGVRINSNLLMDLQSLPVPIVTGMVGNQPRQQFFPWPYFPLLIPPDYHPISKNLDAIKTSYISGIDTVGKRPSLRRTILLHTGERTRMMATPSRISFNILREKPNPAQYALLHEPVAVLAEGVFSSVFTGRIPAAIIHDPGIGFKSESEPTRQIFVSDADIIRNDVNPRTGEYFTLGYDRYTRRIYGNSDFILNCVNYLLDEEGLLQVRSKEYKLRLLDRERADSEKVYWQTLNVAFPLAWVLALALLISILRIRINKKRTRR